jgi:hypothetical protein
VQMTRFSLAAGFAMTLLAGLLTPTAAADATVPLGGGAGITVNGTNCTLTTIGHDNTGALVGFTAGTCGGPGSSVVAESSQASGPVGTVAFSAGGKDTLDYLVIKFDPRKVVAMNNFDGFAINGIGPDPVLGQPECIRGAATGQACGSVNVTAINRPSSVIAELPTGNAQPGDEGAPVTVDGQLVGLFRSGSDVFHPTTFQSASRFVFTLFSAILNDVNSKGVPGAGFTPI